MHGCAAPMPRRIHLRVFEGRLQPFVFNNRCERLGMTTKMVRGTPLDAHRAVGINEPRHDAEHRPALITQMLPISTGSAGPARPSVR